VIEMTLAIAERAAHAAQDVARRAGHPVTVTVVDEAGRLVYCARGDGAPFLTPDTSRGKAVAAANFGMPTTEMVARLEKYPAFWANVASVSRGEILPSGGGAPIVVSGRVIGGIGCSGANAEQDGACAAAGAAAVEG
jgi:uncharacterized protein GlcG (DUF336 family)